jgi:uncharacterized NAD(P)/FAD-binding protein YdhS
VAFGTEDPLHLTNTPAARMSAFTDEPDHFRWWLAENAPSVGSLFVPRGLYGHYLETVLRAGALRSRGSLEIIAGRALGVEAPGSDGLASIQVGTGVVRARLVAIATGRSRAARPPEELSELREGQEYFGTVWAENGLIETPSRDARVLILGTGLTAADTALTLISRGHRGKIVALSRSGSFPRRYGRCSRESRPSLQPETASRLHEIVAWRRVELKAGRILGAARLMKGGRVRGIRIEYFSRSLGTPAKLECDLVLNCAGPARSAAELGTCPAPWLLPLATAGGGRHWESTSIPMLRERAERLASLLAQADSRGG